MGLLDEAIREHLDLKRARGADPTEVERLEREALGPVRREPMTRDVHADVQAQMDERYGAHGGGVHGAAYHEDVPQRWPEDDDYGHHLEAETVGHVEESEPEPRRPKRRLGFLRRSHSAPAPSTPEPEPSHLETEPHGWEDHGHYGLEHGYPGLEDQHTGAHPGDPYPERPERPHFHEPQDPAMHAPEVGYEHSLGPEEPQQPHPAAAHDPLYDEGPATQLYQAPDLQGATEGHAPQVDHAAPAEHGGGGSASPQGSPRAGFEPQAGEPTASGEADGARPAPRAPASHAPAPSPPHLLFNQPPQRSTSGAGPTAADTARPAAGTEPDSREGRAAPERPARPPRADELQCTTEFDVQADFEREAANASGDESDDEDVLEETPDFLQDAPEHDRLWFEQRPPRDFDFDG